MLSSRNALLMMFFFRFCLFFILSRVCRPCRDANVCSSAKMSHFIIIFILFQEIPPSIYLILSDAKSILVCVRGIFSIVVCHDARLHDEKARYEVYSCALSILSFIATSISLSGCVCVGVNARENGFPKCRYPFKISTPIHSCIYMINEHVLTDYTCCVHDAYHILPHVPMQYTAVRTD